MGTLATAHEALRPLGIKPENIKLVMNDMAKTPNSGPAGGSRSQVMCGNATRVACEMLLKGITKADGTFRTYEDMIAEKLPVYFEGAWTAPAKDCDVETGQGNPFAVYMYGAFLSQVEVDITTGKTEVVKMTMVADVGKIANKLVVDGQLYGGLVQGLGLALSEDFEDLKKHIDLIGCGLPFIKDVPDNIELLYVNNAGTELDEPSLNVINGWYKNVLAASGPVNIQLSGGEPTLRNDLPEIVEMGRALGFKFIQLNTNGLRLAEDPIFLSRLKKAGLSSVFLQFDGTEDQIYQAIRGRRLFEVKAKAIECCAQHEIGVVLVPTLIRY